MVAFKSDKAAVEQLNSVGDVISPFEFCNRYDLIAVSTGAYRKDIDSIFRNIAEAAVLPYATSHVFVLPLSLEHMIGLVSVRRLLLRGAGLCTCAGCAVVSPCLCSEAP